MSPSNIEILAYEESPLGPLCLRRRELLAEPGTVVTEITLNHEFLMSSYNTASERALAERALAIHESKSGAESSTDPSLRVLIGGLGLGYTAEAALASDRVGRVEVIELLPQVMAWMAEGLVPLSDRLYGDSRFYPRGGDVYAVMAEETSAEPARGNCYDVILIDVDHSPDDRLGGESERFYTVDGLRRARSHLAKGGVLGVWSYAESSPFSEALRQVFENVEVVPVRFMNKLVDQEEVDWLFFAS